MSDDDIVASLLRSFWAAAPGLPETTIKELNHQVRLHWGGSRPYVQKLGPVDLRQEVPKATYYRWMERSPRRGR